MRNFLRGGNMSNLIEGTCVDYTYDGKGIVKGEGVTVFVDRVILGEKVKVEIIHQGKNKTIGKLVEILEASKERVKPICPIYNECGGCALQHLSYKGQLKFKKNHVKDCLNKIGHIDVQVEETLGMENPYEYRNKTQVPFKEKKGKIRYGFYKEESHDIIPFDTCYIETEIADKILKFIKNLMVKYRISPYDEDKRRGVIRHVLVRVGMHTGEVMVVLVTNEKDFPNRKLLVKEILKEFRAVKTIVQNINTRDTNVILGDKEFVLFGKGYIEDVLLDVKFKISSKSFYQVNPLQTEVLYSKAIEYAKLSKDDVVLDAYCGIGTIGLIASKHVKQVIGVEIVKQAIIDAKNNANLNQIDNANFVCEDASKFMVDLAKIKEKIDVVFLDPPRKGLDNDLIESLFVLSPKRIVYISCNPSTLARDLDLLKEHYNIEKVQPVDMFPQTYHVETVCLMTRK